MPSILTPFQSSFVGKFVSVCKIYLTHNGSKTERNNNNNKKIVQIIWYTYNVICYVYRKVKRKTYNIKKIRRYSYTSLNALTGLVQVRVYSIHIRVQNCKIHKRIDILFTFLKVFSQLHESKNT